MKILAIDTSTDRTSVAVVEAGKVIVSKFHQDRLAHGEALPKLIFEIKESLNNLDLIAIGMGPGPFTGLRSGIAFAQSFALAKKIPWVGVGSLDALAMQFSDDEFIVQIDARRKEVFYAHFKDGSRIGEPQVGPLTAISNKNLPIHTGFPNPVDIAQLAEHVNIAKPIYVRRPDAYPAPKGVKFRAINQLDLVPISVIERESFEVDPWSLDQIKSEYNAPGRFYVVAELNGEVIGYAGIVKRGESGDVLTISVAKAQRRKGIGRELLRRLIDWARTNKCDAMMLEVRIGNDEATPLYTSFGFIEISRRPNYYGPGRDAIVMRKEFR
jgi:tRNA threonylcarbamoyl adenosine modification protein YeaZ/ribosomal-protein-alanine acetyltransferase